MTKTTLITLIFFVLLVLTSSFAYATNSIVDHFKANDGAGTVLTNDVVGGNNGVTSSANIWSATAKLGGGSLYSNMLYFANYTPKLIYLNFSIAFWFRLDVCTGRDNLLIGHYSPTEYIIACGVVTDNIYIAFPDTEDIFDSTLNTGNWYHFIFTFNQNNSIRAYIDNTEIFANTPNHVGNGLLNTSYYFGNWSSNYLDGYMDDIRVYNYDLAQDPIERTRIYNGGTGTEDTYSTSFFDLTEKDIYDGSAITTFNATISNGTYSETLVTTNGTITFSKGAGNFSLNISTLNYFSKFIQSINISNDYQYSAIQSKLILNASEIGTNNVILSFNVSVPLQSNVTINGTAILYLKAGNYIITGRNSSYIDVTKSITISALETQYQELKFGSTNFTVYAKDFYSNATINNYSVTIFNVGYLTITNTTNGKTDFSIILGTYNVTIDPIGYVGTSVSVVITSIEQNYTFYLYQKNSVTATILDEDVGNNILQSVSVIFDGGGYYATHSTTNGTVYVVGLPVGSSIKMTASSSGYSTRDFYVTLSSGSHRDIEMRLSNISSSALRTFTVKTNDYFNIENIALEVSKYQNGSYNSIGTYYTDFSGQTQIYMSSANDYRIVLSKGGYETKTIDIRPSTTDYTIVMTSMPTTFINFFNLFAYDVKPKGEAGGILVYGNTSFNITISAPAGLVEYFGLKSDYYYAECVSPLPNCIANETGGNTAIIYVNLMRNISNVIIVQYWIKVGGYDIYMLNNTYRIIDEYVQAGNLSIKGVLEAHKEDFPIWSRPLMALAFTIITAVGFAAYVPVTAIPIIIIGGLIIFTTLGWIPYVITVVVGLIGILMFLMFERI